MTMALSGEGEGLEVKQQASAGTGGEVFLQPTDVDSGYGLHLTAPLVIAGKAKSKFVVNATGKVGSDSVSCGMNPPVFGFQKVQ